MGLLSVIIIITFMKTVKNLLLKPVLQRGFVKDKVWVTIVAFVLGGGG